MPTVGIHHIDFKREGNVERNRDGDATFVVSPQIVIYFIKSISDIGDADSVQNFITDFTNKVKSPAIQIEFLSDFNVGDLEVEFVNYNPDYFYKGATHLEMRVWYRLKQGSMNLTTYGTEVEKFEKFLNTFPDIRVKEDGSPVNIDLSETETKQIYRHPRNTFSVTGLLREYTGSGSATLPPYSLDSIKQSIYGYLGKIGNQ